jgi:hypothetical protein
MATTHVVSTLLRKRAEVSGYIHDWEKKVRHLRAQLSHIDATILLFAPEIDPNAIPPRRTYRHSRYFSSGEVTKRCQDVLREASEPMTALAIAEALMVAKGMTTDDGISTRRVGDGVLAVLRKLAKRGTVAKTGVSRDARWAIVKYGELPQ